MIATWFVHKRGTAMAVVTFIGGLSATVFILLTDALLVAFGWRQAVFILGILLGAITIPLHALVLRHKPTDLELQPDGKAEKVTRAERPSVNLRGVLRTRYFWILTLAFSLSALSISAVRVHFIPLLISVNIHPSSAALASGAIGVMQVIGRMIFAPLERRFSSKTMVVGAFVVLAMSLPILLLGSAPLLIIAFVVLFGMAIGTHTLARPLIVADTYGAVFYGRISSTMVIILTLTGTTAPFAAGLIFDFFGAYDWMLILATAFSIVAISLLVLLPQHPPSANIPVSRTQNE